MHIIKVECVPVKRFFPSAGCFSDLEKGSCGQAQEQTVKDSQGPTEKLGHTEWGVRVQLVERQEGECLAASSCWLKVGTIQG